MTWKFVIPELALPKKLLQFFGCKASSGIQSLLWLKLAGMTVPKAGFPMKLRCKILKENFDEASSGMTRGKARA